ncbi:transposase [Asaia astilbis]|uniref:transposase n=1 Tax=Asaia astilbis TaxID=610244 RepID=UPI00357096F4
MLCQQDLHSGRRPRKVQSFTLTPGQAHELPSAMTLLDALQATPRHVVCDRGYASNWFLDDL